MGFVNDREDSFRQYEFLGSMNGMLQHGAGADEVHVLFGQQILAQEMDEGAKPLSFSSGQHDPAQRIFRTATDHRVVVRFLGSHLSLLPHAFLPPCSLVAS
jgi:hypothetical protein